MDKLINYYNSTLGKIIRWIIFLPLGFVSIGIIKIIVGFLRFDDWSDYLIAIIPTCIVANAVSYYLAIYLVYEVVPNHKKIASNIFAVILMLLLTLSLYGGIFSDNEELKIYFLPKTSDILEISVLSLISSYVGSILAVVNINRS